MGKILKNLRPFWKMVVVIILLLLVQAWCDLSLPQYTSDIIDTGIQNKGVEHILPKSVTKDEFETVQIFMTDKETTKWKDSYTKDGDNYKLTVKDSKSLNKLDDTLSDALLFNYQLSSVDEATFRTSIAKQMGTDASKLSKLSVAQIGQQMGVTLKTTQKETTVDKKKQTITYVDMRSIYQSMISAGKMDKESILKSRSQMMEKFNSIGKTTIHSMGIAYAVQADKDAGVNINSIQKT